MSTSKNEKQEAEAALKGALVVLLGLLTVAFRTWNGADPLGAHLAEFLRSNEKKIALATVGTGAAGGTLAAVLAWQATLGFWGGLGSWLGFVTMPLWAPVAGGLAGATLAAVLAAGLLGKLRGAAANRAANLRAQVISVMAFACLDEEEALKAVQALHDVLVGSGADKKALKRLLASPARTADEVEVDPKGYTVEERGAVLKHAWELAIVNGATTGRKVLDAHDRLCRRLGLDGEREKLREAAEKEALAQSNRVGAVVDATRALVAEPDAPALEDFLRPIIEMDPLATARGKRLATMRVGIGVGAAVTAVAAVAMARPELLSVVASAYATARTVLESDGAAPQEKVEELLYRTAELGKGLGIGLHQVTGMAAPIDEQVGKAGEKARAGAKKRKA